MITSSRWRVLAIAACFAVLPTTRHLDAQVIDTRTGENSVNITHPLFGQSFAAPAGSTALQQFSFWIAAGGELGTYDFQAYVMSWSGLEPVGPVLYSSGVQNATCCGNSEVSFATGGIPVIAGNEYVAFLHVYSGTISNNLVQLGGANFDSYAGGTAMWAHGCAVDLAGCNWGTIPGVDREFVATFDGVASVPEPGPLTLVVVGACGLIAVRTQRRRA